jgi:hypothetical protein
MQRDLIVSDGDGQEIVPTTHDELRSGGRARVKVLDPMTSIGPSMEAELMSASDSDLRLRVPRWIIPGSDVQVLTPNGVVFGKAWFSVQAGAGFEIEVAVQP